MSTSVITMRKASQEGSSAVDEVEWLIARQIPRLRRYALSLTGDPATADDLVQDCLERAIRKRHLWKRSGSIRNWLYRILYNVFLNQRAHRDRAKRQLALDEVPLTTSEPARQEFHLACSDINSAMQRLPEEQRAAIALIAVEELSYDEAAEILQVPIGTLRSRLFRGRDKLRELYAGQRQSAPLRRVK
jgi:RNA polymerase sigma-70 factor (ECF subfamily)